MNLSIFSYSDVKDLLEVIFIFMSHLQATKLRQQVLGDKDPVTVESLDFFATVYAKVGAEQYEGT